MSRSAESLLQGFLRRAVQARAPLLAVRLRQYAEAEAMSWEELAASLGCSVDALNQVALCRPPRAENFVQDVEAIAGEFVNPARLLPLLRQLQVLETLSQAPTSISASEVAVSTPAPRLFLAARRREKRTLAEQDLDAEPTPTEADVPPVEEEAGEEVTLTAEEREE